MLAWGYLYGIVRANLETLFSHFIFDAALLGLYLAQRKVFSGSSEGGPAAVLRWWAVCLIVWPCLLVLLPFQTLMISLVGLRGCIFFIPMLLLGGRLKGTDLRQISNGLVILNLMAVAFAWGEYVLGLPTFYPINSVTSIIYASSDVAGGMYRIPATFVNAHAYGGTMVASIPFLVGGWNEGKSRMARQFALIGIAAALLGVLMSATRQNFVIAAALVIATLWTGKMKTTSRVIFVILIAIMASVALTNERFGRFKSLSDTEYIGDRISGSVNRGFFEILSDYPMGNGLGGAGTSIPYFLEGQVRNPIAMEDEYARILGEQGVIGLGLWICFICWFFSRGRSVFTNKAWATGRRLVWCISVLDLLMGMIGLGMLTAIPQTAIMLLGMGWTSVPMSPEVPEKQPLRVGRLVPRYDPSAVGTAVRRQILSI